MRFIFITLLFLLSSCDEAPIQSSVIACDDPSDFMLEDLNSSSSMYGDLVGPSTWDGEIRLFYFSSNEQWGTCVSRFASLNDLYEDYLDSSIDVYVIGIGKNNGTPVYEIIASNNLPWVKENSECNVWSEWEASNRDLYIMNKEDEIIEKINLTSGFDETQIKYIINGL